MHCILLRSILSQYYILGLKPGFGSVRQMKSRWQWLGSTTVPLYQIIILSTCLLYIATILNPTNIVPQLAQRCRSTCTPYTIFSMVRPSCRIRNEQNVRKQQRLTLIEQAWILLFQNFLVCHENQRPYWQFPGLPKKTLHEQRLAYVFAQGTLKSEDVDVGEIDPLQGGLVSDLRARQQILHHPKLLKKSNKSSLCRHLKKKQKKTWSNVFLRILELNYM